MVSFKSTKEAQQLILNTLSEQGLLDIRIERPSKNEIQVSLWHANKTKIMEMEPATLREGDLFTIEGLKAHLDVTDI